MSRTTSDKRFNPQPPHEKERLKTYGIENMYEEEKQVLV